MTCFPCESPKETGHVPLGWSFLGQVTQVRPERSGGQRGCQPVAVEGELGKAAYGLGLRAYLHRESMHWLSTCCMQGMKATQDSKGSPRLLRSTEHETRTAALWPRIAGRAGLRDTGWTVVSFR